MGRWILMSRPKINRIKLNRRDINIRQVYVTIRHIASESDENYKEISIMVLIFVDKDSNMNMTKVHSSSAFHFCLPHVVQFRKISKAITNLIFKKFCCCS